MNCSLRSIREVPVHRAGLALAVLALLGCEGDSPTTPNGNGPTGHIVFAISGFCPDAGQIYRMNADGTEVTEITTGGFPRSASPDGAWIAFTRQSHLYAIRSDGTGERDLGVTGAVDLVWSPSGDRILVLLPEGVLALIRPDPVSLDTLYANPRVGIWGGKEGAPWSPDGQRVYVELNDGVNPPGGVSAITVATRQLTFIAAGEWPFESPLLNRVFFRKNLDSDLWSSNLQGGDVRFCYRVGQDLAISRDRRWIAHENEIRDGQGNIVREDVWKLNLAACESDSLYNLGSTLGIEAWSPDGKYVLISRDDFYVVRVTTGEATNVSAGIPVPSDCELTFMSWTE